MGFDGRSSKMEYTRQLCRRLSSTLQALSSLCFGGMGDLLNSSSNRSIDHILSGPRTSLTGSESVLDTTYREIREFGVSLVLLDQMPSKLSGFALANSYATICMSMSNRADINAMTQTLLLDSGKDVLGTLEVGQAVVKLQGRIPSGAQRLMWRIVRPGPHGIPIISRCWCTCCHCPTSRGPGRD